MKSPGTETKKAGCGSGSGAPDPVEATPEAKPAAEAGCCGGAPKSDASACCKKDEDAKAAGETGCGCGTKAKESELVAAGSCCG